MMKLIQILCSLITLGACVFNLSACGQTGPLYLPDVPAAKVPAAKPAPQTANYPKP